jgi:hypothetical protein
MRKRTIRNGMRLVLASLLIIIISSFYLGGVIDVFSLSPDSEIQFYRLGIFWAAAMGGYGVVLAVFGLVLPARTGDAKIRIVPLLLLLIALMYLFFHLLVTSITAPRKPIRDRLGPGETITI